MRNAYAMPSRQEALCWFSHIRLSRLIFLLLAILAAALLLTHYYVSNMAEDSSGATMGDVIHRSRNMHEHEELSSSRAADLRTHIEELRRIKASVNNELKDLESRRQKLLAEIGGYNTHIDQLKALYEKTHYELEQLKMTIENTKIEQDELIKRNLPQVQAPGRILPSLRDSVDVAPPGDHIRCRMHNCFDHSRCSLTSQFPVYLYDVQQSLFSGSQLDGFIRHSVLHAFDASPHRTYEPHSACVYVALVGEQVAGSGGQQPSPAQIQLYLRNLAFWKGDGRNHILINVARTERNLDLFTGVNTGRAFIAQSVFPERTFRDGFDLVVPPSLGTSYGEVWDQLSPLVPAKRKHLLSFHGELGRLLGPDANSGAGNQSAIRHQPGRDHLPGIQDKTGAGYLREQGDEGAKLNQGANGVYHELREGANDGTNHNPPPHQRMLKSLNDVGLPPQPESVARQQHLRDDIALLIKQETTIVDTLKRMQSLFPDDNFFFQFSCDRDRVAGYDGEWALCGSGATRRELLLRSTFSLILAPANTTWSSTTLTQVRVYEALKYGAVPVVLGAGAVLPFGELLQWRRAAIVLPKARVTELHLYLRSFTDNDILEMRRQGRLLWESYISTTQNIVNTVLATVRTRLRIPAFPAREERTPSVFNDTFVPLHGEVPESQSLADDILGPIEAPFPSLRFQRNFSQLEDVFNSPGDPFHSFPFTPFEPILPAEAKFLGSGLGFRPVGKGAGGAGQEFAQALGGNVPREQFTVVLLTYKREAVLVSAVSRLKGLPHLNKVLIVWNNPAPPPDDIIWPDIGVQVIVVRTAKNSLNNRFLPYDAVETEAILSIDDDAHLRHDEIMFGFRVWRENRDRIVGFPGRFHGWDANHDSWLYNSNYTCELSMVLTGAAFFHKYYAYLYSHVMPQSIRDKVDEYLNCEDLAMNFLVSHITRKPPIKVTSRWTFRCPGCHDALSEEESHFHERHNCINFFVKVYGYMPLLYTQYRVDSVLFKTKIPHDKQKCFRFI